MSDAQIQDVHGTSQSKLTRDDAMALDLAWKWFVFHADQRTKMFNFMMIATGFWLAAIGAAYDKIKLDTFLGTHSVSIIMCIFAAIMNYMFERLDERNQYLVKIGEDVIYHFECKALFDVDGKVKNRNGNNVWFGILKRQKEEQEYCGKHWNSMYCDSMIGHHRVVLKRIYNFVIVVFLVLAFAIWKSGS